jgi:hypothetical protein
MQLEQYGKQMQTLFSSNAGVPQLNVAEVKCSQGVELHNISEGERQAFLYIVVARRQCPSE